jgi:hypothetical protein
MELARELVPTILALARRVEFLKRASDNLFERNGRVPGKTYRPLALERNGHMQYREGEIYGREDKAA